MNQYAGLLTKQDTGSELVEITFIRASINYKSMTM
jgi:hypothetical protein